MENPFPDRLAAEVRSRRGSLRLSQRDLAELAGVSERFVRFVEQGKRTVQLGLPARAPGHPGAGAPGADPDQHRRPCPRRRRDGGGQRGHGELPGHGEPADGPAARP